MVCEDLRNIIVFYDHKSRFFAFWSHVKVSNIVSLVSCWGFLEMGYHSAIMGLGGGGGLFAKIFFSVRPYSRLI